MEKKKENDEKAKAGENIIELLRLVDQKRAAVIPQFGENDRSCVVDIYGERVTFVSRNAAIMHYMTEYYACGDTAEGRHYKQIADTLKGGAAYATDGIPLCKEKRKPTKTEIELRKTISSNRDRFAKLMTLMARHGCEATRRRFAEAWHDATEKLVNLEREVDFSEVDEEAVKKLPWGEYVMQMKPGLSWPPETPNSK